MSIDFGPERWKKIKSTYIDWWEDRIDRPIIPVVLQGYNPGRKQPDAPFLTQATCADLSIPAKDLIDRVDYELSKNRYLGDAFPYFSLDCFGPGITAAFLGATLNNSTGRVWYHPKEVLPISELHFEYDPDNIWLNRIKEICVEAMKRWQGEVLVGMTDLGGTLDVISTFRPGHNLLYDLYDFPDEVKRLTWEVHELWHRFYNEINEVLQPINPGYSDWAKIYSDKPSYVLQSDFSYMISPDMFSEFAKPDLEASCRKLERTMYHLDGVGQLAHLDSLLTIECLDAVQWVPGDGKPCQAEWPQVYYKIHQAGKKIQIWNGFDCLQKVISVTGTGKGIHHTPMLRPLEEEADIRRQLANYEVE